MDYQMVNFSNLQPRSLLQSNPNQWLIPVTEVRYGGSAILNNNRLVFYGTHSSAIITKVMSVLASFVMIFHYFSKSRERRPPTAIMEDKLQSNRISRSFIIVGIADIFWCVTGIIQHLHIILVQIIPSQLSAMLNGMAYLGFLSYRLNVNVAYALFLYLTIVRGFKFKTGKFDWKLHLTCGLITGMASSFMFTNDALGYAGYWFLEDASSFPGRVFQGLLVLYRGFFIALVTFDFYSVHKILIDEKGIAPAQCTVNHTELKQLEMFLRGSVVVSIPSIFGYSLLFFIAVCGYIEPLTVLYESVVENLNGCANSWAYFKMVKISSITTNTYNCNKQPTAKHNWK